jgi:hypothetical protein
VRTTIVALGLRGGVSLAASMIGVGGMALVAGMATVAGRDVRAATAVGVLAAVVAATLAVVLRLRASLTGEVPHDLPRVRRLAKLVPVALTLVAWTSLLVAWLATRGGPA